MLIVEKNGLKYYQFEALNDLGVKHGFFTRLGGVSPAPFDSLNMATTVGDSNENVLENLRRMFDCFDLDLASRYDGWQVHSATCICVDKPRDIRSRVIRTDGLITDRPDVTLVTRFGDCVPVVLYDRKLRVAGVYHAGWLGTVKKIGKKAIETMQKVYGSDPKDVFAGIGPSIGPDHFVVREDVTEKFDKAYADCAKTLICRDGEETRINLWLANELTLRSTGVTDIETMGICTVCNRYEWFSHRGDQGKTGRFGVLITLDGLK